VPIKRALVAKSEGLRPITNISIRLDLSLGGRCDLLKEDTLMGQSQTDAPNVI
jgi:hypothetical protein